MKKDAVQIASVVFAVSMVTFGFKVMDRGKSAGSYEAKVDAAEAKDEVQDAKLSHLDEQFHAIDKKQGQILTEQTAIVDSLDNMRDSVKIIAEHVLRQNAEKMLNDLDDMP